MRIKKISVKKYKNLVNFECQFSDSNISAFIGNNGSGKSNLLELITEVFSIAKKHCENIRYNIIVPPDIEDCKIEYEKNNEVYVLKYDKPNVILLCKDKELSKTDMNKALPESIMIYYAGETVRQKRTAIETLDGKYDNLLKKSNNNSFPGYKYIDYFSLDDLSLLLLTAVVYKGTYYEKLLSLLRCDKILPEVTIMLQNPKGKEQENADTYWGAKGFVSSFLDGLRRYVSSTQNLLTYYSMRFLDVELLKNTSKNESEFFAKLKALKNAGYLHWIKLELSGDIEEIFSFDMLSEGEKQLALLYLLVTFTAKDNILYIFDEFDSYMHLNWQRLFSQMLEQTQVNGHIIFTTHSPASISKLQKDDVYKLSNGQIFKPLSDTFNRSLAEVMEEQLGVSLRPQEYTDLVKEFRNAIAHTNRAVALAKLEQIKEFVGEDDPFFITAKIALEMIES